MTTVAEEMERLIFGVPLTERTELSDEQRAEFAAALAGVAAYARAQAQK